MYVSTASLGGIGVGWLVGCLVGRLVGWLVVVVAVVVALGFVCMCECLV